jgi:hypothetical protein
VTISILFTLFYVCHKKGKSIPATGRMGPQVCETSRLPHFLDTRLTDGGEVILTRQPPFTLPEDSWYSYKFSWPEGHSAAGRIRAIEKSNDLIRIWTSDLPACSTVRCCVHLVMYMLYFTAPPLEKVGKNGKNSTVHHFYPSHFYVRPSIINLSSRNSARDICLMWPGSGPNIRLPITALIAILWTTPKTASFCGTPGACLCRCEWRR